jgi:acid phosphatase
MERPMRSCTKANEYSPAGRGVPARHLALGVLLLLALVPLAACASVAQRIPLPSGSASSPGPAVPLPHYAHILVVVEENQGFDGVMGSDSAPYIHALAQQGALFTNSHAVAHPSEPNYLALFAGSTFGLTSDACPRSFSGANLASEAMASGLSFTGYSESMPQARYTGCSSGDPLGPTYARKHNPWVDFDNVPSTSNQPFIGLPTALSSLPTIGFVIPNQQDDMHSGSISAGDTWLNQRLDPYVRWAPTHDSLLVLTWDEDDGSTSNRIATIFVGAHVNPGQYDELITHYDVLRTLEALSGLGFTGNAASAHTIADVWQP